MRTLKITQDEGKLTMDDDNWKNVEQDPRLKLEQGQPILNGSDISFQ